MFATVLIEDYSKWVL